MQRLLVKPAVMLAAILTSGCDWPPELLRVGEKLSAQEKRITEQGEQINSVQSEIEALRAEIQSLKQSLPLEDNSGVYSSHISGAFPTSEIQPSNVLEKSLILFLSIHIEIRSAC